MNIKWTHSFFRDFMFHSCRFPSENPTASWLVLEMYCTAVAPTPLGPFSWRQRCLACLVLISLSLGISAGDLVTTCRSTNRKTKKKRDGLRESSVTEDDDDKPKPCQFQFAQVAHSVDSMQQCVTTFTEFISETCGAKNRDNNSKNLTSFKRFRVVLKRWTMTKKEHQYSNSNTIQPSHVGASPEASSSLWLQDRSSRQRSTSRTWPRSVTMTAMPKNQRRLWWRCCVKVLAPP